jgi:hypothetical protein
MDGWMMIISSEGGRDKQANQKLTIDFKNLASNKVIDDASSIKGFVHQNQNARW